MDAAYIVVMSFLLERLYDSHLYVFLSRVNALCYLSQVFLSLNSDAVVGNDGYAVHLVLSVKFLFQSAERHGKQILAKDVQYPSQDC